MAKNDGKKRRGQRLPKTKGKKNYAKKSKRPKANTSLFRTTKANKTDDKKNLDFYKALLKAAKLKPQKVRVNDFKTGRLNWIDETKKEAYNQKAAIYRAKETQKQKQKLSKALDIPLSKVSLNVYENYNSNKLIKGLTEKGQRIRYKGKFISTEAQNQILKFSEVLDKQGVEYNLNELLAFPEIEKKILVIKDKTPKQLFYWNLQNKIDFKDFGKIEIEVKDFEGKTIYKGFDSVKATKLMNKFSRQIEAVEKVINEADEIDAYFTVPIFETQRDGQTQKILIDYSGINSRLPENLDKKYRQQF